MTSPPWARRAGRRLIRAFDLLVPPSCVLCHRGVESGRPPLCALCRHRLPRLPSPRCSRCAEPAGWPLGGRPEALAGGETSGCPACLEWPDALVAADAPWAFEGEGAALVKALKYGGWRKLAVPMGRAMAPVAARLVGAAEPDAAGDPRAEGRGVDRRAGVSRAVPRRSGRPPVLVPVPLAPARLRERGFNQAERLGVAVGAELGWPVERALTRRAGGGRQARLARAGRRENVRERFRPRPGVRGEGRRAVLVDDVLTTGATAGACAGALAEAGFREIVLVTFARTLHSVGGGPERRARASGTREISAAPARRTVPGRLTERTR